MITDVAGGAKAVTVGSTIYLAQSEEESYFKGSQKSVEMIAHEVVHTFD
jgi:hypothetical protein